MIKQLSDLTLVRRRKRPAADARFIVAKPFTFKIEGIGILTIPAGFVTDLASVPRAFRFLISKVDGIEASVVHDWLYSEARVPRAIADAVFLHLLKDAVPGWRRWLMYLAVRAFGWLAR